MGNSETLATLDMWYSTKTNQTKTQHIILKRWATSHVVRDSSAFRRLFVRLVGAVGRQSALHKENSGFATPTLGRHISTFRGYQILFSIQNPYINRFTNHFSIHSKLSNPQKVVLHSSTTRFSHRPYHFAMSV